MKSLLEKSKETQTKMKQKVKEVLHQRNDMRNQMEEALTAKEAVSTNFSVFVLLRCIIIVLHVIFLKHFPFQEYYLCVWSSVHRLSVRWNS